MNEDKKQVKDLIKKLNTKKYFTMYFQQWKKLMVKENIEFG